MKWITKKLHQFSDFITWTALNRIWRAKFVSRSVIIFAIWYSPIILLKLFEDSTIKEVIYTKIIYTLFLFIPLTIIFCYCSVCLLNKRFHDLWFSWWWQLLELIPFVNVIVLICLLFIPGNKWGNKYGEPCKSKKREKICAFIIPPLYILFMYGIIVYKVHSDMDKMIDESGHFIVPWINAKR